MMKRLEITTGFLQEENTLKNALTLFLKDKEQRYKALKKVYGKFVPNQHLYIADIKNCKSLLKKLQS